MRYYSFDDDGYLTGSGEATPGDVPGSFVFPRNATTVEPPTIASGMMAKWTGFAWIVVASRTPEELIRQANTILLPLAMRDMAETAPLSDPELVTVGAAGYFDEWEPNITYAAGKRLTYAGIVYVVEQPVAALAHQPPGSAGMLAVYRPVRPAGEDEPDGSSEHPFDLVVGMKGETGKYYRHAGEVWECLREMANILEGWLPGAPGMESFWRKVE